MRTRVVAATLLGACSLAGCGAAQDGGAADVETSGANERVVEELLPAPPVEAIDEPAPARALDLVATLPTRPKDWVSDGEGGCVPVGLSDADVGGSASDEPCPREVLETILAHERPLVAAKRHDARAVARLRLDDGGAFYVVEYRSRGLGTCAFVYGEDSNRFPTGGSAGGIPCTDGDPARFCELCVVPAGGFGDRIVLAGTVPANGNALRITFEDGHVARYPLTGPLLPSNSAQRVFMVDHTRGVHSKLELLSGEDVIAVESLPLLGGEAGSQPPEQTPGTEIELDGRTLHIEIRPEAPPEAQALLDAERVGFACIGADDPKPRLMEDAPASAEGLFEPGERTIDVELAAEPTGKLLLCSAGPPGPVEAGLYRLFVSVEEFDEQFVPTGG